MPPRDARAAARRAAHRISVRRKGNSCLVASRRSFPLDVFGMTFGGTTSTTLGGSPSISVTCAVMACASRARASRLLSRDSATITSRSVPATGSAAPNATTQPLRTPGTLRHGVLDFVRIKIVPRMDDDVLHAAGDVDFAVGAIRAVAGVDPSRRRALGKQRRRRGLVSIVALRRGRSAKPELSLDALSHILSAVIHDSHFVPRNGRAHGDERNHIRIFV